MFTIISGVCLIVGSYWLWRSWENHKISFRFQRNTDTHMAALNKEIDGVRAMLESVQSLYLSSEVVDQDEFSAFVKPLLKKNPSLISFEWISRIPAGKNTPELFPLSYAEPLENRDLSLGENLGTNIIYRQIMFNACDTQEPAAMWESGPDEDEGRPLALRLFIPVYLKNHKVESIADRHRHLQGFVSCTADVSTMLQRAWAELNNAYITTYLAQKGPSGLTHWSYDHELHKLERLTTATNLSPIMAKASIYQTATINTMGIQWNILMVPGKAYISQHREWPAVGIPAIILLCTILLVVFIRSGIEKTDQIIQTNIKLKREIKERHMAQNELRKERDFNNALIQSSPTLFVAVDAQGIIQIANQAFFDATGYSAEETIGSSYVSLLISDENRPLARETAERLISQHKPMVQESVIKTKNNNDMLVEWHLTPMFDHRSDTGHYLGVGIDVTERRQKEEALRQSEERYTKLIQTSPDGIFITTLQCQFLDTNHAFEKMIGYPLAELQQMSYLDLVPEENRNQWADLPVRVAEQSLYGPVEFELEDKQGVIVPVSLNGWAIQDKQGKPEKLGFIARDIRARKQAEKEREELTVQLLHAQKMESVGTLAGGIAHDFNNILGIILGYSELIKEVVSTPNRENPVEQEYINEILTATHRAKDLVQQILTISRHSDQERRPLQLSHLVKETAKFLRASIPATIEIQTHIQDQPGVVLANPTQMHQILMNLCTNSAHAMQKSGGVLQIQIGNTQIPEGHIKLPTGRYVQLTVKDSGNGIHPKILKRIFDPYFTTKDIGEGTGLGLAVVNGIVQSYGGDIRVESQLGQGTSFELLFPAIESMDLTEKSPVNTILPMGTERILFVDDEKQLAAVGKDILQRLGYQVVIQTDSIMAQEFFATRSTAFDLVITDMTMPKMTGLELAYEFKKANPDIPIILCTGFSNNLTKEKLTSAGIVGLIEKPISPRDLATSVRQALDQKKN